MADLTGMLQAAAGAGGEYEIERSLRFNSADSAYLDRTPASDTSSNKKGTFSCWIKISSNSGTNGGTILGAADTFFYAQFFQETFYFGNDTVSLNTAAVFRDFSAWYHVLFVFDTTLATENDRMQIWVNGVRQAVGGFNTQPSQNSNFKFLNTAQAYEMGRRPSGQYLNGYLTEINFIDGQALTPSSFGEINADTGVWSPIRYAGTYGTNGFYLNFSDNSGTTSTTLGKDYSGNGNNWTPNNFSVTAGAGNDSLVDSPTRYGTDTGAGGNVRGNYCTLNPLAKGSAIALANGNLDASSSGTNYSQCLGTFGMSSGKWYWEVTGSSVTGTSLGIGIAKDTTSLSTYGGNTNSFVYINDGQKGANDSFSAYGNSFTANDVIGVAFDADAGEIKFYKNNTVQNSGTAAFTGLTSGPYLPVVADNSEGGGNNWSIVTNFGQRPFAYTAPSGFKALVTTNLPDPTIVEGNDYFNTVLYTGTGSSQSITGVGFQPDFVWIKERNASADHGLYDAVRGVQNQLESNTTTDETTESTGLTAFGTNGFTVGSLAQLNTSADTYVAWNWKESTTSKFDIVTYTGNGSARTISHNLGVVPNMIIVKARTTASTDQGWAVYHSANTAAPETDYLLLNSTAATADLDTVWNDTLPTSSVFSVGTNALVNANNDTYVAYLFANVAGYSAFGSYTGNGSANGTFVYTGFRPAFVMVKRTNDDFGSGWYMWDNKRPGYNWQGGELFANATNAEDTAFERFDILSNGFKLRSTGGAINGNGDTMIYMAFSQNPFKLSLAR
jgi:hypothetical protein